MNQRQRQQVAQQANFRCGYCQTQEVISGVPLTVEHILPKARGGSDDEQNLWLSCRLCNEAKGILTEAIDPQTKAITPLFNPRAQVWAEHFTWADDGAQLIGLTSIGRATIVALSLNSDFRLRSRRIWVEAGYHPPD
jgi:hypothetical protein